MVDNKIKILLIEDDQDDAWIIARVLTDKNVAFELTTVQSKEEYVKNLYESTPDIVLCDHGLPLFSSNEALEILKESGFQIPYILVTGAVSDAHASKIMKAGADDYVLKDRLQRLPSAVMAAVTKFRAKKLYAQTEFKVKENEKKYASLIKHLPANIALLNNDGIIIDVNESWKQFAQENGNTDENYSIGRDYVSAARSTQVMRGDEGSVFAEAIEKILKGELSNFSTVYPCHSPSKNRWFRAIASRENQEHNSGVIVMHIDVTEQLEAEQKAKKSEANLLSIFNSTDIGLILTDKDFKIVSCNNVANAWGFAAWGIDTLQEANLLTILEGDNQQLSQNILKKALAGVPFDDDDNFIMRDGSVKWFRIKMNQVTNASGEVMGLCIAATDITEKIHSRKKLEESEKRFHSIIENSTDMKTLVSKDQRIIYVSPSVSKSMGYTVEELFLMSPFDLVFEDDRADVLLKIQEILKTPGQSLFTQHRLIDKTGQLIWCEGTITNMLDEPSVQAIVSNLNNISDRKKLEILFEKANKLARLGSWELDNTKNLLYWSDITKQIHEVAPDYVPNLKTAINFYKEGDSRKKITEAIKEAMTTGKSWDVELQIMTAKQNEKWVRAIGDVEMTNGVCTRISGSFQDIDEAKKIELERERIANELLMNVENLEQFGYIVSHNLRAPVANILGLVNLLQHPLPDVDRIRAQNYLFDAVTQMDVIIKDLNKILQIRSAYVEFREPVFLPDLVRNIEASIKEVIIKEDVRIETAFNDIDNIITIKSYIHSIFYNLIINSIKYRKIGISPIIKIESKVENGKILFKFQDNGIGIDLNQHGKNIFKLYRRFHLHVEGKGLGLYMIKTQIEVLGGRITVKSTPEIGTEFNIELPL